MSSFPDRNSVFCPVDYTADFVAEGIPKPHLLFTTVQGNPKPTTDPEKIPDRAWTFVGKALLLPPSNANEVQKYRLKYDFTKVDVPVVVTASGSVLGTMQLDKQKNVYNANRYMTWKQDTENPRIVYIDMMIPACLLKQRERSLLDFTITINDAILDDCTGNYAVADAVDGVPDDDDVPVDYTADFVYDGVPKPHLLFTTVQGNPKPTTDPEKIPDRAWTFVGKALLLPPSNANEVQKYRLKYDFTKVDVPVVVTASGSLLGTMEINQQKNVYNANRYMTWKQDTENPRIVYIDMRIPSCLLKKGKRSVLDFSIILNDGVSPYLANCKSCSYKTSCHQIQGKAHCYLCFPTSNGGKCSRCTNTQGPCA